MLDTPPRIRGGMKERELLDVVERWNRGEIPVLLAQCKAVSHGLNLQAAARDMIWFGLPDSVEQYIQAVARLWRQGASGEPVNVSRILSRGTVDEDIRDRIEAKDINLKSLLNAMKRRNK